MSKVYFMGVDREGRTLDPLDLASSERFRLDEEGRENGLRRRQFLSRAGVPNIDTWLLRSLFKKRPDLSRVLRDGSPPRPAPPSQARGILSTLDEDPADLSRVGWGVIFPEGRRQDYRAAIRTLIEHRRSQLAGGCGIYREFEFRKGQSVSNFLSAAGIGPGEVDIRKMPYYLLIVGSPIEVPFSVQFQLDAQYAVGRICFPERTHYRTYADNVVRAESKTSRQHRTLALFGTRHKDDWPTEAASKHLGTKLASALAHSSPGPVKTYFAEDARKEDFLSLLKGPSRPSVLFSATHALCFRKGDADQAYLQGALLCQDWPGPGNSPTPDQWVCADDIQDDLDLTGLVAFQFACFSAGTPNQTAKWFPQDSLQARLISEEPFVSPLAQRLLSHQQGALAVVGHVDQAYVNAFLLENQVGQAEAFEVALRSLMRGEPVGLAMETFGQRYGNLAAWLLEQEIFPQEARVEENSLKELHFACHDSRSYAVLGDPAVRLPLCAPQARPVPELATAPSAPPRLHALLIGVSFYFPRKLAGSPSYPTLRGPVKDVERMRDFLKFRMGVPSERIQMLTASDVGDTQPYETPDRWPTYDNMIEALDRLIEDAKPGDQVLIHFAGHGGRLKTCAPQQKGVGGIDESLVPLDVSSNPDSCHLRDVEIADFLRRMRRKGLFTTLVLDCCHSGGATRGESYVAVRGVRQLDTSPRPPSRVLAPDAVGRPSTTASSRVAVQLSGWSPEGGSYVMLAACQATENAYECRFENGYHGALSYWLLDSLERMREGLTYRGMYDRILSKVRSQFTAQTPLLEGDCGRTIFGWDRPQRHECATVIQTEAESGKVLVNAGLVHGLRRGALLSIHSDISPESKGIVEIQESNAVDSWCRTIQRRGEAAIEQGDRAVVVKVSTSIIKMVRWSADSEAGIGVAARREFEDALQERGSGFLELMGSRLTSLDRTADFQVAIQPQGLLQILDSAGNSIALYPALSCHEPGSVQSLVERLIRLAKFRNVAELESPPSSPLLGAVTLEVHRLPEDYQPGDEFRRLPLRQRCNRIEVEPDSWLCFTLKNVGSRPLNIAVLALQSNWAINQVHPRDSFHVLLERGKEEPFALRFSLPEGVTQGIDTIKVFAIEGSTNLRWLEQAAIDQPTPSQEAFRSGTRSPFPRGDLQDLLAEMPGTVGAETRGGRQLGLDPLEAIQTADASSRRRRLRTVTAAVSANWTVCQADVAIISRSGRSPVNRSALRRN